MRKGKIKNSIVTIAMAMMLSVTAVVGFGTNAKAAAGNTGNKQYSYSNIDPIGSCEWRTKNNATKVYVYPSPETLSISLDFAVSITPSLL